jgi:hypothetical protein
MAGVVTGDRLDERPSAAWTVGELVDTARRAAELIGRERDVLQLAVYRPSREGDVPTVQVTVGDQDACERARLNVTGQEMLPHFFGISSLSRWTAEIDDMVLSVSCAAGVE